MREAALRRARTQACLDDRSPDEESRPGGKSSGLRHRRATDGLEKVPIDVVQRVVELCVARRKNLGHRGDRRQRHIGRILVRDHRHAPVGHRPRPGQVQARRHQGAHVRKREDSRRRRRRRPRRLRRRGLPRPTHARPHALEAWRRARRQGRGARRGVAPIGDLAGNGAAAQRLVHAPPGVLRRRGHGRRGGATRGTFNDEARRSGMGRRDGLRKIDALAAAEHDGAVLVVPRVRHRAVLEVLQVRVQALHMRCAHVTDLPARVLPEAVLRKHGVEALRIGGQPEVDKGVAHIAAVLDIHRQVEEVVCPCEAHLVDLLQQCALRVLVRDVPQHQRRDRCVLTAQALFSARSQILRPRHSFGVVRLERLSLRGILGREASSHHVLQAQADRQLPHRRPPTVGALCAPDSGRDGRQAAALSWARWRPVDGRRGGRGRRRQADATCSRRPARRARRRQGLADCGPDLCLHPRPAEGRRRQRAARVA
mmetsp:Transcript_54228/g.156700  ORF Transcript_54228/g.156700 Transcript_54228/m.156700 type:complete len:483 (-) Transcript_54228:2259-3707(-)